MAESNKKFLSLSVIVLTALLCVAFFMLRVWHLNKNGLPINYLAELWAPSSVLSIAIVTYVEEFKLVPQRDPRVKKNKKNKR